MCFASRRRYAPVVLALLVSAGCRTAHRVRDVEYSPLSAHAIHARPAPIAREDAVNPVVTELAGPHAVDDYIRFALSQNPSVQATRKMVDARTQRVTQMASLDDPSLSAMSWPSIPHAPQYVNGRMTADVVASQKVPWHGTLRTQALAAEKDANVARAQLAAAELDVIEKVRRAYYELYYVQQALEITRNERKLLDELSQLAETKYRNNKASQQDVLRAQLEVATLDSELVRLNQQLASAQASLARQLHVSPETPVRATAQLPPEQIPDDLDRLYHAAVAARPELHAALAAIDRDRQKVELAHLKYFPDVTVSMGWGGMTRNGAMSALADGRDNLGMGLMVNVPIYRRRLDAGVREAEARVVSGAREYDALRDQTLEEVKDLYSQATSQNEMLRLFHDNIVPKADQTLKVSLRAYEVGEVDFLQLVDNWRQVLRFQLAEQRLESQLRQSLAMLERVVGTYGAEFIEHDCECGRVPYDYCHPAPLPYQGFCECPTPVAAEYLSRLPATDPSSEPASAKPTEVLRSY